MTPRHSYYWLWKGLLRDVGGRRSTLYGLLPTALILWFVAGMGLVSLGERAVGEPPKPMPYEEPLTLKEYETYAKGRIEGAKRNRFTPFQIEAGKVRDYLVERMEERLAQAERGFQEKKMKKIRIAVVIDKDGCWEAFGGHNHSDDDAVGMIQGWGTIEDGSVVFVTAEVPVPHNLEVAGKWEEPK